MTIRETPLSIREHPPEHAARPPGPPGWSIAVAGAVVVLAMVALVVTRSSDPPTPAASTVSTEIAEPATGPRGTTPTEVVPVADATAPWTRAAVIDAPAGVVARSDQGFILAAPAPPVPGSGEVTVRTSTDGLRWSDPTVLGDGPGRVVGLVTTGERAWVLVARRSPGTIQETIEVWAADGGTWSMSPLPRGGLGDDEVRRVSGVGSFRGELVVATATVPSVAALAYPRLPEPARRFLIDHPLAWIDLVGDDIAIGYPLVGTIARFEPSSLGIDPRRLPGMVTVETVRRTLFVGDRILDADRLPRWNLQFAERIDPATGEPMLVAAGDGETSPIVATSLDAESWERSLLPSSPLLLEDGSILRMSDVGDGRARIERGFPGDEWVPIAEMDVPSPSWFPQASTLTADTIAVVLSTIPDELPPPSAAIATDNGTVVALDGDALVVTPPDGSSFRPRAYGDLLPDAADLDRASISLTDPDDPSRSVTISFRALDALLDILRSDPSSTNLAVTISSDTATVTELSPGVPTSATSGHGAVIVAVDDLDVGAPRTFLWRLAAHTVDRSNGDPGG